MGYSSFQLDYVGIVCSIQMFSFIHFHLIPFRFLVPLCGIVIGHLYFFLVFKYPQDFGGPHLLQTPSFL